MMLGEMSTPEAYARARAQLGLDKPFFIQYSAGRICRFDLGRSIILNVEASTVLAERLKNTLKLTVSALFLPYLVGITFGVLVAVKRNTWFDYSSMGLAVVGVSVPEFWPGFLLISLSSVRLHWFPIAGYGSFRHLVLPALTLSST